ncbi:uncharacterized protein LOC100176447 isoform X2 [Ciona intestinalis]
MSHHLNLDFAVLQPGKEPASKKLQKKSSPSTSAKKRESKKLDIDNKQMEWRLNQLKQAMEKQKEERGKQGYIWKSGKNVSLDSHSRNILGRTVNTTNKSPSAPTKPKPKPTVTILKDEPLDLPKRGSRSKELLETLKNKDPVLMDMKPSEETPSVNKEKWISVALDRSHDEIMEIQSDMNGNLPLSSLHGIEPSAVGLYFLRWSRKRLLPAVDNKVMMPKSGWGNEVYYPYVSNPSPAKAITASPPPSFSLHKKAGKKTNSTEKLRNSNSSISGGKLLQGSFNEDESAKSFQEALNKWRQPEPNETISAPTPSGKATPVEMSVHAVQSDPVKIDIQFSETSTLSYMERLLLKKHRSTDVPPLPNLPEFENKENYMDWKNEKLSEEDLEERDRIRQLFSPSSGDLESRNSVSTIEQDIDGQSCVITEVPDKEVLHDTWTNITETEENICFVDEASDEDDKLSIDRPFSRILIEEVKFGEYVSPDQESTISVLNQVKSIGVKETTFTVPKLKTNRPNSPMELNTNEILSENYEKVLTPKRPDVEKSFHTPRIRRGNYRPNSGSPVSRRKMDVDYIVDDAVSDDDVEIGNIAQDVSGNQHPHDLIQAVSQIPLNPDAYYTRGLGEIFGDGQERDNDMDETITRQDFNSEPLLTDNSSSWNPLISIAGDMKDVETLSQNNSGKSKESSLTVVSDEQLEDDIERETADAETLDQLEWELASQTGNLTTDGRISRMIEDWSSDEDELGIINDPGFGSGLSTPEVDHASLGAALSASPWQQEEGGKLERDFQQMESFMMDGVSSDSNSD